MRALRGLKGIGEAWRQQKAGIRKKRVRAFLPPDPVIVDCGAHKGADTVEMATMWPQGTVYAFEPVPALYEQLVARTADLPNVICRQLALGPSRGEQQMWVSAGASDASSSLRAPKRHLEWTEVTFDEKITVPVSTLDDELERADFLWLDMQGYELEALKGAPRVVAGVQAIALEVFEAELYEGAPLWPKVRAWLESEGFRIEIENMAWKGWSGDILAVRH